MKKVITVVISLVFLFTYNARSQEYGTLGITGGMSGYYGELNSFVPFLSPSYYAKVVYRHNLKYRYVFKFGISFVNMQGNSKYASDPYQRTIRRSFSYYFGSVDVGGEFNFFKFDNRKKDYYFTPYISYGISFISVPDPYFAFDFAFPVGFGVKYAFTKKLTIGAEISYNWTYSDFLDRIQRDDYYNIQRSYNTNPDSYSLVGIFITYQLFHQKPPCPVYTYF